MTTEFAGRADLPAPEFPPDLEWINVPAPLTMQALRGKIVLLDFWTYGCINCIHMIPVLEQLEARYGDALVVIGVHSAKFENEGEVDNLRQIVQRYELRHPVINDRDFLTWRAFAVRAWPTFVVIDPRGNILAMQAGEIPFEAFDRLIGGMVEHFGETGELNREPLALALEGADQPASLLAYPGKVLADEEGGRLFIADSGHHRIVIADLETYAIIDVIGSGARGLTDGAFEQATFNKPQGMALLENTLYIADTDNHAIRAADLVERTVRLAAGTGEQSYARVGGGPPEVTALNSPWDLAIGDDSMLFIAMAGPHQLWAWMFNQNVVGPIVGSGREGLVNDSLAESELAQPSGIAYEDGVLYFADSESSTIRAADLRAKEVRTLAGTLENNLFDFGDIDGKAGISRLQHPLGVSAVDPMLYVADTYNSRIKALDLRTELIETIFGLGSPGGFRDGGPDEAEFNEPGGLSYAAGMLYVADTNNHAIRVIDLAMAKVRTITFSDAHKAPLGADVMVVAGNRARGERLTLPAQSVAEGSGELLLRLILPDGYKLNPNAPSRMRWGSAGDSLTLEAADQLLPLTVTEVRLPLTLSEGTDVLYGQITLYYCREGQEGLCLIDEVAVDLPVEIVSGGTSSTLIIERAVTPPQGL